MKTKAKKTTPKHGDLRIWWVPQMPCESFKMTVANLVEARLLLDTLAKYDQFQYAINVKGDYANAGGLQAFDTNDTEDGTEGSWLDWHSDEGEDFDHYELADLRKSEPKWEGA